MKRASPYEGRPILGVGPTQSGQALIYGMFVLIGSLTALFFLFNTGQLSSEKTKLVNTADAVAYSAGVMHARALNFDAYNNRALVANEVLVAQLVSLSSWAQYAKSHAENLPGVFPECADQSGQGAAFGATFNYGPLYAAMCYLTVQFASVEIEQVANLIPDLTREVLDEVEVNKSAIQAAQLLLHAPLYFQEIRGAVMQQVADKNYAGDGTVSVQSVNALLQGNSAALADNWETFTQRSTGDERIRFAEVAKIAAYSDKFVKERNWDAKALLPPFWEWKCLLQNRKNSVKRRGGTELISLDEWKAEDTESFWRVRNSGGFFSMRCSESERPIAEGEQRVFPPALEGDASAAYLGGSPSTNPQAHGLASSTAWTNYSGLPSFYELTPAWLANPDPRLIFAVRLVRNAANTRTSDGASPIAGSEHLNRFDTSLANGVMAAMATSEVYFERPWFNTGDDTYTTGDATYVVTKNQYAVNTGNPDTREIGSLFNPYWQIRLVPNRAEDVTQVQSLQGLQP